VRAEEQVELTDEHEWYEREIRIVEQLLGRGDDHQQLVRYLSEH
jgi:hypothetical protein